MSAARVTVHMATSLDVYIAREDGRVDWMETHDEVKNGQEFAPEYGRAFLDRIRLLSSERYEPRRSRLP